MLCLLRNIRYYSSHTKITMKYLNVAEKNDAAKTIAGFLSRGTSQRREGLSKYNKLYIFDAMVRGVNAKMTMTSVSGHLLTHAFVDSFKNWHGCDPISLFDAPVYKMCPENFINIRKTLEKEIKTCNGLIIWTDCDREGENIGFEIINVCRAIKPNISVYRAKFSEITETGIKRALDTIAEPDERQSLAVDARSELDLRIGAAFTRFLTMRYQRIFPTQIEGLVSYGSCQIPTLGFVARRFNDVEKFIPQKFWKLKLTHQIEDLMVEFNWNRVRFFDENCCQALLMVCQESPTAQITSVQEKPKNKWRPKAMDTIELEKLGSRMLKISAKETMTIAEKLYTQGIISYPRTETNMFSKEIDLRKLVENQVPQQAWGNFANRVLEWGPNPNNGNKSDQAHPPIHPTKLVTNLQGNEQRVYELIVRHFLACVSKDATGSETVVIANVANELFTGTGLRIYERNYLDVYIYEKWNAKEIHPYQVGNTFEPTELSMVDGSTTPPSLLTEADLIALMDKHGIGTDATHAEHINTIKTRGYIGEIRGRYLVPGTLGMGLVEGYDAVNLPLAYPELRAELERDLKLICTGERNPTDVLREQIKKYKDVYKVITEKIQEMDATLATRFNITPAAMPEPTVQYSAIEEVFKCPKCDKFKMSLRAKRDNNGFYLSCLGKPECNHVIWFTDIIKEIKVDETICPNCRRSESKKLNIKFKRINILALLNDSNVIENNNYLSCIVCDSNLRSVLSIEDSSMRRGSGTNNTLINSSNRNENISSSNNSRNSNNITTATSNTVSRPPLSAVQRTQIPPPPLPQRPHNSSNNNSFGNDQNVLCPQCNQPAKKLTVKKDGPNKGRPFYVCPKQPACQFFQWADVPAANNSFPTSSHTGTSTRPSASSSNLNENTTQGQGRAKRKCGICKEEGHTRLKCPRRLDAL